MYNLSNERKSWHSVSLSACFIASPPLSTGFLVSMYYGQDNGKITMLNLSLEIHSLPKLCQRRLLS